MSSIREAFRGKTLNKLLLDDKNKKILVVEGRADKEVYENFFDVNIHFDYPHNKHNNKEYVLDNIRSFKRFPDQKKNRIIGIIDRDFQEISDISKKIDDIDNLFYTDTHDLESMIFSNFDLISDFLKNGYNINKEEAEKIYFSCLKYTKLYGFVSFTFYELNKHIIRKRLSPIFQFIDKSLKFDKNLLNNEVKFLLSLTYYEKLPNYSNFRKKMLELWKKFNSKEFEFDIISGHDLSQVLLLHLVYNFSSKKHFKFNQIHFETILKYNFNEIRESFRTSIDLFKNQDDFKELIEYRSNFDKICNFDFHTLKSSELVRYIVNRKNSIDLTQEINEIKYLSPLIQLFLDEFYKIEKSIRDCYNLSYFKKSCLYKSIHLYERNCKLNFLRN